MTFILAGIGTYLVLKADNAIRQHVHFPILRANPANAGFNAVVIRGFTAVACVSIAQIRPAIVRRSYGVRLCERI